MTAQKGKDILLKIGDAASPEVFASIGGLRTKGLSFNGEAVDITNSDSASQWRELLAAGGVAAMGGVADDDKGRSAADIDPAHGAVGMKIGRAHV